MEKEYERKPFTYEECVKIKELLQDQALTVRMIARRLDRRFRGFLQHLYRQGGRANYQIPERLMYKHMKGLGVFFEQELQQTPSVSESDRIVQLEKRVSLIEEHIRIILDTITTRNNNV